MSSVIAKLVADLSLREHNCSAGSFLGGNTNHLIFLLSCDLIEDKNIASFQINDNMLKYNPLLLECDSLQDLRIHFNNCISKLPELKIKYYCQIHDDCKNCSELAKSCGICYVSDLSEIKLDFSNLYDKLISNSLIIDNYSLLEKFILYNELFSQIRLKLEDFIKNEESYNERYIFYNYILSKINLLIINDQIPVWFFGLRSNFSTDFLIANQIEECEEFQKICKIVNKFF